MKGFNIAQRSRNHLIASFISVELQDFQQWVPGDLALMGFDAEVFQVAFRVDDGVQVMQQFQEKLDWSVGERGALLQPLVRGRGEWPGNRCHGQWIMGCSRL